ncbi:MAG: phosphopantothenoylcysteine decarboxylase [Candidatus Omnitrophica bacterium]|nr:phosphopantothenoylcysteine decarboxylase [Candidatus Omnitrophota bacterium]
MKRPHILITAGPTREMLDPVRFLSNLSTGEMGYELARTAARRNYSVTLISGPTALKPPGHVRFIPVVSAKQMEAAVKKYFPKSNALIMTAAVCDYTPVHRNVHKIKRIHKRNVLLKRTDDILKSVAANKKKHQLAIGFCLETEHLEQNAIRKLHEKNLDWIVANHYSPSHNPFGKNQVTVLMIDRELRKIKITRRSKRSFARYLISLALQELKRRGM